MKFWYDGETILISFHFFYKSVQCLVCHVSVAGWCLRESTRSVRIFGAKSVDYLQSRDRRGTISTWLLGVAWYFTVSGDLFELVLSVVAWVWVQSVVKRWNSRGYWSTPKGNKWLLVVLSYSCEELEDGGQSGKWRLLPGKAGMGQLRIAPYCSDFSNFHKKSKWQEWVFEV